MGILSKLGETVKARLNPETIASEVLATVIDRISHGASEVAHGLFTQGTAYVPYGQDTLPITAPEPSAQEDKPDPEPPSLQDRYEDQLAFYSQRVQPPSPPGPSL